MSKSANGKTVPRAGVGAIAMIAFLSRANASMAPRSTQTRANVTMLTKMVEMKPAGQVFTPKSVLSPVGGRPAARSTKIYAFAIVT